MVYMSLHAPQPRAHLPPPRARLQYPHPRTPTTPPQRLRLGPRRRPRGLPTRLPRRLARTTVNPPSAPHQLKTRKEPAARKRLLRFAAGGPVNCPMAASVLATMTLPPCPTSSSVSRSRSRPTPGRGSCAGSTPSATAPTTASTCVTAVKNPEIRQSWPGGRAGPLDRPDASRVRPRLQAPVAGRPGQVSYGARDRYGSTSSLPQSRGRSQGKPPRWYKQGSAALLPLPWGGFPAL